MKFKKAIHCVLQDRKSKCYSCVDPVPSPNCWSVKLFQSHDRLGTITGLCTSCWYMVHTASVVCIMWWSDHCCYGYTWTSGGYRCHQQFVRHWQDYPSDTHVCQYTWSLAKKKIILHYIILPPCLGLIVYCRAISTPLGMLKLNIIRVPLSGVMFWCVTV